MARLNKCIICGSKAEIVENSRAGDIRCSNSNCINHNPTFHDFGHDYPKYHFLLSFGNSKKSCIKLWNEENEIEE